MTGEAVIKMFRGSSTAVLAACLAVGFLAAPANAQQSVIKAKGEFTNGRGACGYGPFFTDDYIFTFEIDDAAGEGTLTIDQPSTGDVVSGPIFPDGTIDLDSKKESYDGTFSGDTLTADYDYIQPGTGCVHEWDAVFTLERPAPLPAEVVEPDPTPTIEPTPTPSPVETTEPPDSVATGDETDETDASLGVIIVGLAVLGIIVFMLLRRSGTTPAPAGATPPGKGGGPRDKRGATPRPGGERPAKDKELAARKAGRDTARGRDAARPAPAPSPSGRGKGVDYLKDDRKGAPAKTPDAPERAQSPAVGGAAAASKSASRSTAPVPSPARGRVAPGATRPGAVDRPARTGPRPSEILGPSKPAVRRAPKPAGAAPKTEAPPRTDEKAPSRPGIAERSTGATPSATSPQGTEAEKPRGGDAAASAASAKKETKPAGRSTAKPSTSGAKQPAKKSTRKRSTSRSKKTTTKPSSAKPAGETASDTAETATTDAASAAPKRGAGASSAKTTATKTPTATPSPAPASESTTEPSTPAPDAPDAKEAPRTGPRRPRRGGSDRGMWKAPPGQPQSKEPEGDA